MKRRARGSGSIYFDKRRRRWAAVVEAGYDITTGRRRRLTRHTTTQREAIAALHELAEAVKRGRPIDAGRVESITLADYIMEYIRVYKAAHIRPKTLARYEYEAALVGRYAPALRMADITTAALQGMINRAAADGLARSTIEGAVKIIFAALDTARDDGYIAKLPSRRRLMLPPAKERRPQALTAEEYAAVRAAAANRCDGLMPVILDVARYMGLRRAEIMGMTWEQLDTRGGLYHVTAQLAESGELAPLKTSAGRRVVPVPPPLLSALIARRREQTAAALRLGVPRPGLIFCHTNGAPYNLPQISEAFMHSARAAGVFDVSFHSLRHTYATDMAARVDVKTLQGLLGHASAAVSLDIYAESDAERLRAAVCPMAVS